MNNGFFGISDGRGFAETRIGSAGALLGRADRIRFSQGTNVTIVGTLDRTKNEIDIAISSANFAPTNSTYVCVSADANLTAERTLAGTANVITLTDGGANGNLTINIPVNAIDNTRIRDSGACSVIGRSANSTGDPADIAASASYHVLRRDAGNTLGFGLLSVQSLTLLNGQALIGKSQNGSGAGEEITSSASYQVCMRNNAGTIVFSLIDQNSFNFSATDRLLGRATAGSGAGELITCTAFGRSLIDDADAATARTTIGIPADSCCVSTTQNQTIANSTDTVVTFDTEFFDTANLHSNITNPGRITISKAGKWFIGSTIRFASNSTGRRVAYIRKNGTTIVALDGSDGNGSMETYCQINTIVDCAANDYFEVLASQNSGGNLAVEAYANYSNNFYAIMLDN